MSKSSARQKVFQFHLRNNLLRLSYNREGSTNPDPEFYHCRLLDAPVVTPSPFSVYEYLQGYQTSSDDRHFRQMRTTQNALAVEDGPGEHFDMAFIEWSDTQITGALAELLAVIAFVRKRIHRSYTVEEKWITRADWPSSSRGCAIRRKASPINVALSTARCRSGLMCFGLLTSTISGSSTVILECKCVQISG